MLGCPGCAKAERVLLPINDTVMAVNIPAGNGVFVRELTSGRYRPGADVLPWMIWFKRPLAWPTLPTHGCRCRTGFATQMSHCRAPGMRFTGHCASEASM